MSVRGAYYQDPIIRGSIYPLLFSELRWPRELPSTGTLSAAMRLVPAPAAPVAGALLAAVALLLRLVAWCRRWRVQVCFRVTEMPQLVLGTCTCPAGYTRGSGYKPQGSSEPTAAPSLASLVECGSTPAAGRALCWSGVGCSVVRRVDVAQSGHQVPACHFQARDEAEKVVHMTFGRPVRSPSFACCLTSLAFSTLNLFAAVGVAQGRRGPPTRAKHLGQSRATSAQRRALAQGRTEKGSGRVNGWHSAPNKFQIHQGSGRRARRLRGTRASQT